MELLYKRKSLYRKHFDTGELGVPLDVSVSSWQVHYLMFGIAFSLLSFFILLSIIGLIQDGREKKFMRRHYFIWVNFALFYFCLSTALSLLIDPFEDRRFMKPRAARQAVHLLIRLRLPFLAVAYSLVQVSLLNITEIRLYATRFHNMILIFTLDLIYFALVIISTVSSMFVINNAIVWLLCDIYMFLLFFSYTVISLYTGIKIIHHYHRDIPKFLRVVSGSGRWYRSTYGHDNDNILGESSVSREESEKSPSVAGVDNDIYINENADSPAESGVTKKEDISVFPKKASLYPIYVDDQKDRKIVIEKRRIGSMPYQTHSSKFVDKSIRKVTLLMVLVAICGLVLCIGMIIALWSAAWFDGHNLEGWRWYTLRTVLRLSELGASGTMAYMVRRTICC